MVVHIYSPCLRRFVRDYLDHRRLSRTVRRLKTLATTQGTIISANDVSPWLGLCRKLEHALKELDNGCLRYAKLANIPPLSPTVLEALTTHLDKIQQSRQYLVTLQESLDSTHKRLIMTGQSINDCDKYLTHNG